jgi:phosphohistidine swiveling domain-containing protein
MRILSKKSIVKFSAWGWDIVQCSECGQMVVLKANESLRQSEHWKKHHGESVEYQDPGFQIIEEFEYPISDVDFGVCPHCDSDMEVVESGGRARYFCDKCGYIGQEPVHESFSLEHLLEIYPKRTEIQADQITSNIWLGDITNAWLMRDRQTGKPFDAILNVSQNSYSPPPDVEYAHIPIEEHDKSPAARARRLQDIRQAVDTLERWTNERKKIYVHCREGMNRSPSVIAAYLIRDQLRNLKNPTEEEKENLYNQVLEDIQDKRYVAMPHGEMENALREYLGLPKIPQIAYTPALYGGWFGKPKAPWWFGYGKPKQPPRYYPGERGIMQTYPKFPPPGGVIRRKKRRALSKKSIAQRMFSGFSRVAQFIRYAVSLNELYNFYAVMQLPPAFYEAFPKWNTYAENIVRPLAQEYAAQLEDLVREEVVLTLEAIKSEEKEEEEYHEHEWSTDNESYHSCEVCGEKDEHDFTAEGTLYHACDYCGDNYLHEYEETSLGHRCVKCNDKKSHRWALVGDQAYKCVNFTDQTGITYLGCPAETDILPDDEEAPYAGDFWEEYHQHQFQPYPQPNVVEVDYESITPEEFPGEPYRCPLCGRAFLDTTGQVQLILPHITPRQEQQEQQEVTKSGWRIIAQPRQRELFPARPEPPPITIDTSKWFDFSLFDPERNQWVPWSTIRSTYKPSSWRLFERALIAHPESVLTTVAPVGETLREQLDEEKLKKFKYLVQLKRLINALDEQEIANAVQRLKKYEDILSTDADDVFLTIVGVKPLYETKKPDEYDALIWKEIQPDLAAAWKRYKDVLLRVQTDPDLEQFFEKYPHIVPPDWVKEFAGDRAVIAKGVGTSPGTATGRIATTAEMALQVAQEGPVILVRPETTPEDIAAMNAAVGFLTAHGGPTAHAAIVARQMGKPCVTGTGFTVDDNQVKFPNGKTLHVGTSIMINGTTGEILAAKAEPEKEETVEREEEKEEEGISQKQWDEEFSNILEMEKTLDKKLYREDIDDLESADLADLARVFNTDLSAPNYGGPRWALAAVRAVQLQEALRRNMPWRYLGLLIDQINTLQHNTGNIFSGKSWPGYPSRWIDDALDTKGSEHAMYWMEPAFTDETKQMLRDYRMWSRRTGYPSLYGTNISHLTPEQRKELRRKEMEEVRRRRKEQQRKKWARWSPVAMIKTGNIVTAFHMIARARLSIECDPLKLRIVEIPLHWRGRGIARQLADTLTEVMQ